MGGKLFYEILALRPFGKLNSMNISLFQMESTFFSRNSIGEHYLPIHSVTHTHTHTHTHIYVCVCVCVCMCREIALFTFKFALYEVIGQPNAPAGISPKKEHW